MPLYEVDQFVGGSEGWQYVQTFHDANSAYRFARNKHRIHGIPVRVMKLVGVVSGMTKGELREE